jgi:hypothetical protein
VSLSIFLLGKQKNQCNGIGLDNIFDRNIRPAPVSKSVRPTVHQRNGIGSVIIFNRNIRPAPPSRSGEDNNTLTQRHRFGDHFQPQNSTRATIKIR